MFCTCIPYGSLLFLKRTAISRLTIPEKGICMRKADVLILGCSPREDGNSDHAARQAAREAVNLGHKPELLYLRDYHVLPCTGCHKCALSPEFKCVLDNKDQCRFILDKIDQAGVVCFCSPVFFYHLPAGFKALIDRGQSVYERWIQNGSQGKSRKALVIMVAGRKKGEALFKGSLLTMKYFLEPFGRSPADLCLRGVDAKDDLKNDVEACRAISDFVSMQLTHEI